MTTPTHVAVGYLLAEALIKYHLVPPVMIPHIHLISAIFANIPDIDGPILGKFYDHRTKSPFHYPFTWWFIFVTLTIIVLALQTTWLVPYIALAAVSVIIHFFMDSFGVTSGLCWLAPFHYKEFSLIPFSKMDERGGLKELYRRYFRHPVMFAEISIWIFALLVFFSILK